MSSSRKRSAKNSVPGKTTQSVPELKAPMRPNSPSLGAQSQPNPVISTEPDTNPTDIAQTPLEIPSLEIPSPETPSLEAPSPETPSLEAPSPETPSLEAPSLEAFPVELRSNTLSEQPEQPEHLPEQPEHLIAADPTSETNPGLSSIDSTSTTVTNDDVESPCADEDAKPETATSEVLTPPRQHPIPPPSEPMQYRAIGLVRGRYVPGEEQLTQGSLHLAEESLTLPAVLLGRVMSLVKNHLNLERDYLWVVYPRVLGKPRNPDTLCFQIVGVWEPALLNRLDDGSAGDSATVQTSIDLGPDPENGYFSIRGEVIGFSEETQDVTVNIRQLPRKPHTEGKSFKLPLKGLLTGKVLGHFWDLDVLHDSGTLRIRSGTCIGFVAPKKRSAQAAKPGHGGQRKKPQPSSATTPPTPRPASDRPAEPIVRREPLGKPVKKSRPES